MMGNPRCVNVESLLPSAMNNRVLKERIRENDLLPEGRNDSSVLWKEVIYRIFLTAS